MFALLRKWLEAGRPSAYEPLSNNDNAPDAPSADEGDILTESSASAIRDKIDRNLLPLMMFLYGVHFLDKATLGRAAILGFIEDNNLTASQFVLGASECSVTFAFLLVTSMFYTKKEQSSRVGYWFLMNGTAQIVSNLMGYGVLSVKSTWLAPWQWFTLLNAALTFITAVAYWFYFPDSVSTAAFLTAKERKLAVERNPNCCLDLEHRAWKPEQFYEALRDPKTWLFASFSLCNNIPTSIGIQRGLIVESFGFTRFQTTLLGTLDGVIEIITIYTGVKLVEYFGDARAYIGSAYMVSDVLSAILVTSLPWANKIGLLISVYLTDIGTTGFVLGLALQTSSTAGHTKRSTTQAIMLSAYCVGNLIGPHMWQEKYKPRNYLPWFVIGTCYSCCIVLLLVIRRRLARENKRRDAIQGRVGLETSEVTETDLTDLQNPKFRYVL
ncbi:hypothetical protein FRC09_000856 [Ceratobasidium sp. 395]|nr:hypothetical protein FRC09_000856 [Ceratobasidium sp. 395]